jgi:hypothetical protein
MNWKLTLGLVVLAAAIFFVGVYWNPFSSPPERRAASPWFYQVSMDDIVKMDIAAEDKVQGFHKNDQDAWEIDGLNGVPPDPYRWGGIVLLLSGPQTRRDFSEIRPVIEDPAEYGLDDPGLIVDVGLTAERHLEFRLGDETPDGNHHYGQVVGFPQLYLIADTWGEVLARLAHEPPIPKWWIQRDPEDISEFNIDLREPGETDRPRLRLQKEEGEWFARHFPNDEENRPLDTEKWSEYLPLIGGPGEMTIEKYRVTNRDYADWGIDEEGLYIEYRFSGLTEVGVKFTDGVPFLIGDKAPDGEHYYGIPISSQSSVSNVVLLDADWVDSLFGLVSDVPYAQ